MSAVLERARLPLGSLVVDAGLVITLVFIAGQMTNRFEAMDARLAMFENEKIIERIALLEQRASAQAAMQFETRREIIDKLDRIEAKLDGKVDKDR